MLDLGGTAIVVTGATRGLGRAFAIALAAAGADVVAGGRDAAALDELVAEISAAGGSALAVPGSVAEEAVAVALVERGVEAFGRIDGLVNNAGVVRDRTLLKMTVDEFDEVIATNLRGTWLCGREAARAMKERGGVILNVVSNVAFHGSVGQSNYAASKAGVAGLTRAWSQELARYAIRVNALWPVAETDMTGVLVERLRAEAAGRGEALPTARQLGVGTPAEVAEAVVFLMSREARGLTGQILTFNGQRLAVWSHPREASALERDAWSAADIARALNGDLPPEPMHPPPLGPTMASHNAPAAPPAAGGARR